MPGSIERFRRDHGGYSPLAVEGAITPIFMSYRQDDTSPEIARVLQLIADLYRRNGVTFGQ